MGKSARSSILLVVVATLSLAVGCGGNAPAPHTQEMVPANSANEPAMKDDTTAATTGSGSGSGSGSGDPGGGAGNGGNAGGAAKPGGAGTATTASGGMPERIGGDPPTPTPTPTAKPSPATSGPKVTKSECKKVLDRYVDLAIAADPNLAGLPPDVIKQAFAQAAAQSANPCDGDGVSRDQYKCAMKATSADRWQACMK